MSKWLSYSVVSVMVAVGASSAANGTSGGVKRSQFIDATSAVITAAGTVFDSSRRGVLSGSASGLALVKAFDETVKPDWVLPEGVGGQGLEARQEQAVSVDAEGPAFEVVYEFARPKLQRVTLDAAGVAGRARSSGQVVAPEAAKPVRVSLDQAGLVDRSGSGSSVADRQKALFEAVTVASLDQVAFWDGAALEPSASVETRSADADPRQGGVEPDDVVTAAPHAPPMVRGVPVSLTGGAREAVAVAPSGRSGSSDASGGAGDVDPVLAAAESQIGPMDLRAASRPGAGAVRDLQGGGAAVGTNQVLSLRDGQTIVGRASLRELTRIDVRGEKIESVRVVEGQGVPRVTIEIDETSGDMYLSIEEGQRGEFVSGFVTTAGATTFQFQLMVADIPSDTISVVVQSEAPGNTGMVQQTSSGAPTGLVGVRDEAVLALVEDVLSGVPSAGFASSVRLPEPFAAGPFSMVQTEQRVGPGAVVHVFRVSNTSRESQTVPDSPFARGAAGVFIEKRVLGPGETSRVIVVEPRGAGQ
jgi:hypothetical protein